MKLLFFIIATGLIFTGCSQKTSLELKREYIKTVNNEAAEFCDENAKGYFAKNGCYFKYKVKTYRNDEIDYKISAEAIEKSWLKDGTKYVYDGEINVLNDMPKLTKEEWENLKKELINN